MSLGRTGAGARPPTGLPVALAADTITYHYRSDTITYRSYRFMTTKDLVDNSQPALTTMKISGGPLALFATHPPLELRIARLEGRV